MFELFINRIILDLGYISHECIHAHLNSIFNIIFLGSIEIICNYQKLRIIFTCLSHKILAWIQKGIINFNNIKYAMFGGV